MRHLSLIAVTLALAACATPYKDPRAYWARPDGTLVQLVDESEACYRDSVDAESPAAFPNGAAGPRLLPRTEPPPKLWERAPRNAGFEKFDEQLRYERCMRVRGWRPTRTAPGLY
ncbi:MAG TPA: hypothetical protein VFW70_05220 [Methylomirabilota bacterium]|nr:hypothetical protein [Methylomirabilota bacterium]